ncbi:response regulator transcription factor [Marinicrinis lubricantis]|uniref:Helix-turn-helix domain-containing protein n=1 Tax=Marinicrinis lubricantis TaxID=2086470 RepID=A0ABW1IKI7_9BACL
MYKVMLVDDDYPVIELLEEAVRWEALGLMLIGSFENGAKALEAAEADMPDILITDIGMPKMDGLTLIRRLKERSSNLRVAILSCHSEFEYAKQAMQLQVQDYIVKDTLHPDDLVPVLERMVKSLNDEQRLHLEQHRLRHMVDRSRDAMREKWVHGAMQQPLLREEMWSQELESFGLPAVGRVIVPVVGLMHDIRKARSLFVSDENLRFAVTNVLDEVIRESEAEAVLFPYQVKEWFILHSFRPTLAISTQEEVRRLLERIGWALRRILKLQMSFVIGERSQGGRQIKQNMRALLHNDRQRFYMSRSQIVPLCPATYGSEGDIFVHYDEAIRSLHECVLKEETEQLQSQAARWMQWIAAVQYAPETVKDWTLKLLLDIRLKHQAVNSFRGVPSLNSLHKEAADIGSLHELQDWLTSHLLHAAAAYKESGAGKMRREVLEAYEYVALHMDRRIGLEDIAEHLHLNPSYFSRLFKKETGETFIEYVTRMKMERAKELLDQTARSVAQICELLGYENQSYFIKLFKSFAGMTPLDYRHRGLKVK